MRDSYFDVIEATWPPARKFDLGAVTLREGLGGGSRVSAATVAEDVSDSDLDRAEAAMRDMGQEVLFMLRPDQEDLDARLEARGYQIKDPVWIYAGPIDPLCDLDIPRVTVLQVWEPLAIMRELWASGGIGTERVAVMERATGPKTALLGRHKDKPAGAAFVAIHDGVAMLHALEILPFQRRAGMGKWFVRAAAIWARGQGAQEFSVICTRRNDAANALYSSLGLPRVGQYHYRILTSEPVTQ